jgi:hypothetical protein
MQYMMRIYETPAEFSASATSMTKPSGAHGVRITKR